MPAPAAAADERPIAKRHDTRGPEQLNIPLVIEAISTGNPGLSIIEKETGEYLSRSIPSDRYEPIRS
jgi:hypothetical protein